MGTTLPEFVKFYLYERIRTDEIDCLFLIACCIFADVLDNFESCVFVARKDQFVVVVIVVDILFAEVELDVKDLAHFDRCRLIGFLLIFFGNLLVCIIPKVAMCI